MKYKILKLAGRYSLIFPVTLEMVCLIFAAQLKKQRSIFSQDAHLLFYFRISKTRKNAWWHSNIFGGHGYKSDP